MVDSGIAQKMRQIAGYIYGALFIFELFTLYYVLVGMAVTGVPLAILFEILVLPLAGAACVACIAGRDTLADAPVRAAVIGTGLMVVFELVTVQLQVNLIASSMSTLIPSSASQTGTAQMIHYVLFAVRLVLMILAAFFLTSARDTGDSEEIYEEDEENDEESSDADETDDAEKEEELEEKTEEIKESVEKAEDEAEKVNEEAEEDAPEDKKDEE